MPELRGIYAALVTPFEDDERVDHPRLRQIVGELVDDGVAGLFTCGSTGEFFALSTGERKAVLETVVDEVAGRVQVVPHTGANSVREAVELTRHAEGLGLHAAMLVSPYYERLSLPELRAYYRGVADQSGLDIVVYNNPAGTGVNLSAAFLAELAESSPTIRYVKDSAADRAGLAGLLSALEGRMQVLNGSDSLLLEALELGCAGAVLGAANFLARECVALYDDVRAGDAGTAAERWAPLAPLMQQLDGDEVYVRRIKAAMALTGRDAGRPLSPVAPLDAPDVAMLRAALDDLDLLALPSSAGER
jgi:4-hydroxy-tetrahydrodipicolinate synthase